jgi:hypothetical protein
MFYGAKDFIPTAVLSLWAWYGESDSQYSEAGIKSGSGWVMAQSLFNVFEVMMQLAFLLVIRRNSVEGLLTIFLSSMATFWKTLIYMCIIAYSDDPVQMVPGLYCMGYRPKSENLAGIKNALMKDSCVMQLFKFQFNFWWIVVPGCIVWVCWNRITYAFRHEILSTNVKKRN